MNREGNNTLTQGIPQHAWFYNHFISLDYMKSEYMKSYKLRVNEDVVNACLLNHNASALKRTISQTRQTVYLSYYSVSEYLVSILSIVILCSSKNKLVTWIDLISTKY